MRQIPGQMSIFDYMTPAQEYYIATGKTTYWQDSQGKPYRWWEDPKTKPSKRIPPVHRYLRYGPHTLIPEVREETKAYLDANGVPDWVEWSKDSLPCENCTWWDGTDCRSGGHTNHFEYGYLICDGFYQSIVERKPSTVGDSYPKGLPQEHHVYPLDIRGLCDDPYCPQCGSGFWTEGSRSQVDCERCPECHVKVDWTPWHRCNDEEEKSDNR